jgi:UDP-glucose 4-epimerase
MDLVDGHLKALGYSKAHKGCSFFNLGAGEGVSVLQLVKAFEEVTARHIPYQIKPRREGDVATSIAKVGRANSELDFHATRHKLDLYQSAWYFYEASQGKL